MKKLLICGNYGATNIGDEAILAGLIKTTERKFQVKALSYNPQNTKRQHKIDSFYLLPFGVRSILRGIFKGEIIHTINGIRNCDTFILGGGGLFSNEHWKAVAIWSLHAFVAKICGKPVIMMAQTVEYIDSIVWRWVVKKTFKGAKKITVRDKESKKVLEKMGIQNVSITADPAWLLKKGYKENIKENKIENKKQEVIISLRIWKNHNSNLVKTIVQFAKALNNQGYLPVLMSFQTIRQNDQKLIKKITTHLKANEIEYKELIPHSPKEALTYIRGVTAVVGMRLHSCIFSAICEVPFIAISYSSKVKSFVEKLKMKEESILIKDLNKTVLNEKFKKLIANHRQIKKKLCKAGESEVAKAQLNLKAIL